MNEVKWMWSEVNFIVIKWSEYGEEVKWMWSKNKINNNMNESEENLYEVMWKK